jgi:hypothetical protein
MNHFQIRSKIKLAAIFDKKKIEIKIKIFLKNRLFLKCLKKTKSKITIIQNFK